MKNLPTTNQECYEKCPHDDIWLKDFALNLHGVQQMNTPVYLDFLSTSIKLQNCAKAYRKLCNDWVPDWNNTKQHKYFIVYYQNRQDDQMYINYVLSFPSIEVRETFINNFSSDVYKEYILDGYSVKMKLLDM